MLSRDPRMPLFSYRALTPDGNVQQSCIEAETPAQAHERLRSRQLMPLRLRRQYLPTFFHPDKLVTDTVFSTWCEQLSTLLQAGIALDEALDELQQEFQHNSTTPLPALANLGYVLREGKSLSAALTDQADSQNMQNLRWIRLIAAGEKAGHLPQTLHQLAEHLAWQSKERQQTRQSLLQPLLSAASVIAATVFLLLYLAPQLRPLFNPEQLPLSTRTLFWLTDGLAAHSFTIVCISMIFAFSLTLGYQRHPKLKHTLDRWYLQFPLMGQLHLQQQLARYIHTWGLLYKNGIPLLEAMQDSRLSTTNSALQHTLTRAESLITSGHQIHSAFEQASPIPWPPSVLRMLRHGEKTGLFAEALLDLGKQLESRYQQTTQKMHSLLQPTVTVVSGALLAWVASALLGPLYGQFSHALH